VKVARALAGTLAVSRAAFGVNYLLRPEEANRSWIGPVAKVPATQVIIRSQAARDLALGGGALRALARGDDRELRAWMAGQTVADLTDTIATWLARRKLPKRQSRLASVGRGGRRKRPALLDPPDLPDQRRRDPCDDEQPDDDVAQ
jgi:Domain of unknown function (DUF4267)